MRVGIFSEMGFIRRLSISVGQAAMSDQLQICQYGLKSGSALFISIDLGCRVARYLVGIGTLCLVFGIGTVHLVFGKVYLVLGNMSLVFELDLHLSESFPIQPPSGSNEFHLRATFHIIANLCSGHSFSCNSTFFYFEIFAV